MSSYLISQAQQLKLTAPVPSTLHPAAVYLNSLAVGSRRAMLSSLNAIAKLLTDGECDAYSLDWSALRYHHTAAVVAAFRQRYAPATTNKAIAALRRVLTEAYRLDLMSAQDYQKAVDIKYVKGNGKRRGRALEPDEISGLISCCLQRHRTIDLRDAALIAILRCGGIRRQELVRLKLADLNLNTGELTIEQGKGGKCRLVYLTPEALKLIKEWLQVRTALPGALICPVTRAGHVELRHFADNGDGIYKLIKKRAEVCGIDRFSPHDFRRTFCTELLDKGSDVLTVRDLAGHSSADTTAIYDRRGEARKRQAASKLGLS